jgi:AAA15 family ATPase/GTPase
MTGFLDESDSALFPESRIAYFRMLESAHGQSVRRHTVMVTHSSELQEMLTQKIDVTALAVKNEEAAA